MSDDLHAEGKRNDHSAGCMVMMIIIALAIIGLLGWLLLWGRSIPAGEESQASLVSSRVFHT